MLDFFVVKILGYIFYKPVLFLGKMVLKIITFGKFSTYNLSEQKKSFILLIGYLFIACIFLLIFW